MKDEILARMYVVLTLLSVVPLLVAGQVIRVSVFQGPDLREAGERQSTRRISIPAMRGTIVDRTGRTLAVNTARYDIAVDPTMDGFSNRASAFFDRLARITGKSAAYYRGRVARRSSPQYVELERSIDETAKDALVALDVPGLIVLERFSRRYTYGKTAAHLLGHVDTDMTGIAGVERIYDGSLHGEDGWQAALRGSRGVRPAAQGTIVEPAHGETVVLTIDLVRQSVLEEELERGVRETGANWGAAVAMDPWTGEILAMANYPSYDPNRPGAFSHFEQRNHAVTDQLEPGSTFKLVTAVAAIEEDVVSLDDSIDTGDGWMMVGGRTLRDTHALGKVTFRDIISESSNIGFAKVAELLENEDVFERARALGFGRPTGIDLPGEASGVLKDPSEWSGTTRSAMSRGYEVSATPLQVLVAYAALANGGTLVQPYVVAERRDVTGRVTWTASQDSMRRAIRSSTVRTLMPAFEQVVTDGSAEQAQVDGIRIAGKTGTAMKTGGGSYQKGAYRASFVGYYPVERPRVVLMVVLDEPRGGAYYGGAVAAPVFRETVRRWLATTGDAPEATLVRAPDTDTIDVVSPKIVRMPVALAAARVRAAGLRTGGDDDDGTRQVSVQRPEPGAAMRRGSRVRLDAEPAEAVDLMPDLRGLTVREATWWLTSMGVRARIEGSGIVRSQSPNPGSPLGQAAVLRCR